MEFVLYKYIFLYTSRDNVTGLGITNHDYLDKGWEPVREIVTPDNYDMSLVLLKKTFQTQEEYNKAKHAFNI